MLQTSEQLIAISAPDWQIWQAKKRENAARARELEDQKSQARLNYELRERGYDADSDVEAHKEQPAQAKAEVMPMPSIPLHGKTIEEEIEGARRLLSLKSVDDVEIEHLDEYRAHIRSFTPGPDYNPSLLFPAELNKDCDYASATWLKSIEHGAAKAGMTHFLNRWLEKASKGSDRSEYFIDGMSKRRKIVAIEAALECGAVDIVELFNRPSGFANKRSRKVIESIALCGQLVGRLGQKKCTSFAMYAYQRSCERADNFLKSHKISNGKMTISLADAGHRRDKALSELYTILKGMEKLAKAARLRWARVVVTLPSHYHSNPQNNHGSWDYTMPDESTKLLQEKWELVRSRLAYYGITSSGVWTRELMGDATPHCNFMLFFEPGTEDQVKREFCEVFGYDKPGVDFMLGQEGKDCASFATYCIKYFFKFFVSDEDVHNLNEGMRDAAGFSAFGIRRYGFFGIPSLGQWRELRKLRQPPKTPKLKKLWNAARGGRADEWIALSGGLAVSRGKRPVKSIRAENRIIGVEVPKTAKAAAESVITSTPGTWKIIKCKTLMANQKLMVNLKCPRAATNAAGKTALLPHKIPITLH